LAFSKDKGVDMKKLMAGLTLTFVMAASLDAIACTCLRWGTVLEELAASDAVFSGRVLDVQDYSEPGRRLATVEVVESWKGVSPGVVTVETRIEGAECGYPLRPGENHLFYAYRLSGNHVHVNICTRTMLLSTADGLGDIDILRRTRR
jgi:hypothetical protein